MPQPLKEVYAYVGQDEQGNEGFVLAVITPPQGDPTVIQLIAPNREIADQYRQYAEAVAQNLGRPVKLVRFSNPQQLEVIS